MHPRGVRKQVLLPPGAATNVVVEVSKDGPIDEACWFCCQIDWVEKESRLELLAKKLDGPMYWMAAVLGANWNPPWRHKHHDYGVVFASNVSAASYFNEVYGFTQGQWLEEQRLEQQRQDELARLQTASRPAAFRSGRGLGKPPTAEEVVAAEAKRAFAAFCRASTNGTDNAAAGASPTPELGAPPSGSPDPRGINPR